MYPMDTSYGTTLEDRMVTITLRLYRMPIEIHSFDVRAAITNDDSGKSIKNSFRFYKDGGGGYCNMQLFRSKELWNLESLSVTIDLKIYFVEWADDVDETKKAIILQR